MIDRNATTLTDQQQGALLAMHPDKAAAVMRARELFWRGMDQSYPSWRKDYVDQALATTIGTFGSGYWHVWHELVAR